MRVCWIVIDIEACFERWVKLSMIQKMLYKMCLYGEVIDVREE